MQAYYFGAVCGALSVAVFWVIREVFVTKFNDIKQEFRYVHDRISNTNNNVDTVERRLDDLEEKFESLPKMGGA